MESFRRFVAIGDSSTEGLEDSDGQGGYRGWADRLAQHLADAQEEPLEYANLAVRGLRLSEIRNTQFDDALGLEPDLLTIFGGVNDAISMRWNAEAVHEDYAALFSEARGRDITVLTFTMPDLTAVNPFARRVRARILMFNDIIRAEAERYGVLVMDFERYPITADPRLWAEDRLHGSALGHERIAAALAARLGVAGFDDSWADPIAEELLRRPAREQVSGDLDWALHHLAPWVGKGIRGISPARGVSAKRPRATVVPKSERSAAASGVSGAADRDR
ncbi:MAG: SGNH/GDSL hydrolase family protein [Actinomycetes bacterium]